MQNVEDAMEKGEMDQLEGPLSPSPTSPTLCGSATGMTSKDTTTTAESDKSRECWYWSPRNPLVWLRFIRKALRTNRKVVHVVTRRLNDSPKGYPNMAAFQDSDGGFAIYRRFGWLQSRLILDRQEELRRLELQLERMDLMISKTDGDACCTRDLRGQFAAEHNRLLTEIEAKFCSYSNLLQAAHQLMGFAKPAEAERQSVGRYIHNRKPLIKAEASWIQHKDDLVTLRAGREHAWLDGVVEGFLTMFHCRLIDFVFRSKETRKKTEIDSENMPAQPPKDEDKYEIYYTPSRIAKLTNCILTVIILTLLVLPIYLLYHIVHETGVRKAYVSCIGTLLVFTLAFSSVLSLFTKARRHEILAAAAAYCAVLVVFLGNVGPNGDDLSF